MKFYIVLLNLYYILTFSAHAVTNEPIRIKISNDGLLPYDSQTYSLVQVCFYNAVLGQLLKADESLTLKPSLLSHAYFDFYNNRYILRLPQGLKFHNGRGVTVEDLEFSLTRFFLSHEKTDKIIYLRNILGIDSLKRGSKFIPGKVEGLRQIDSRTLSITLKKADPTFLLSLSEGWIPLVPQEALNDDYITWKNFPVGAGPYRVVKVDKVNKTVQIESVNKSGKKRALFEFISTSGREVDLVGGFLADSNPHPQRLKMFQTQGDDYSFFGIFFNYAHPLAQNPNFRAAVNLALDKRSLAKMGPNFEPLDELLTHNYLGRINSVSPQNMAKAKDFFQKIPPQLLRQPLVVYTHKTGQSLGPAEEAYISEALRQIETVGFRFIRKTTEHPSFDSTDKEAVLRFQNRGTIYRNPVYFFSAFVDKDGYLKSYFPSDEPVFLKKLEDARQQNKSTGKNYLRDLSQYFREQNFVIPLFERRKRIYWIDQKKIKRVAAQRGTILEIELIELAE